LLPSLMWWRSISGGVNVVGMSLDDAYGPSLSV
jgi:hypothetical protein